MKNTKESRKEEDFQDNSFLDAQEEAQDGKAGKKAAEENDVTKSSQVAKDALRRAKNASKDVTIESEQYRRDKSENNE
ncbi:hypothetical protein Q4534_08615 [Cyclobacterium sp. 1_MG-2023]|uniref:hypothetical protein n=1 Tax=Cyclobacterium sp. 1_MG-2023 TaxID=3062681 RepID=UPI0026E2CB54|nr:hypothetical protein [Cyclobacterium sp. 1_MG-2023]MDO6437465.1 hypothetical protein [Cyclobacterium sp. 1_MG-2023]